MANPLDPLPPCPVCHMALSRDATELAQAVPTQNQWRHLRCTPILSMRCADCSATVHDPTGRARVCVFGDRLLCRVCHRRHVKRANFAALRELSRDPSTFLALLPKAVLRTHLLPKFVGTVDDMPECNPNDL